MSQWNQWNQRVSWSENIDLMHSVPPSMSQVIGYHPTDPTLLIGYLWLTVDSQWPLVRRKLWHPTHIISLRFPDSLHSVHQVILILQSVHQLSESICTPQSNYHHRLLPIRPRPKARRWIHRNAAPATHWDVLQPTNAPNAPTQRHLNQGDQCYNTKQFLDEDSFTGAKRREWMDIMGNAGCWDDYY